MLECRVTSAHRAGLTHAAVSARLPRVSGGADAHEGADEVLAGHASAGAVVQPGFALVVVWETNGTLSVRENACDGTVALWLVLCLERECKQ